MIQAIISTKKKYKFEAYIFYNLSDFKKQDKTLIFFQFARSHSEAAQVADRADGRRWGLDEGPSDAA